MADTDLHFSLSSNNVKENHKALGDMPTMGAVTSLWETAPSMTTAAKVIKWVLTLNCISYTQQSWQKAFCPGLGFSQQQTKACIWWHIGQVEKLPRRSESCSWGDSHATPYSFRFYLPPSSKWLLSCFAEFLTDQWPSPLSHKPVIFLFWRLSRDRPEKTSSTGQFQSKQWEMHTWCASVKLLYRNCSTAPSHYNPGFILVPPVLFLDLTHN